jgi:hypothetical protein
MKASAIAVVVAMLAVAANGCGHAEQIRQAQEHERFLKDSLGTVAPDQPVEARAHGTAAHAVD